VVNQKVNRGFCGHTDTEYKGRIPDAVEQRTSVPFAYCRISNL